jgi:hypothetical protein
MADVAKVGSHRLFMYGYKTDGNQAAILAKTARKSATARTLSTKQRDLDLATHVADMALPAT